MATDDERREVAERMRISAERYDFCAHNIALDMDIDADYDDVYDESHRQAWLSLADLIEPAPKCSEDEMGLFARTVPYQSAGKRVATFARRIRECCGEAS